MFFEAFQIASYGSLGAEGFVPSMHSKCRDLSCRCSWLDDSIFAQRVRALWSFRTLASSRSVSALDLCSMGYYHPAGCSVPRGLFSSGERAWVITVTLGKVLSLSAHYNKTSVNRK